MQEDDLRVVKNEKNIFKKRTATEIFQRNKRKASTKYILLKTSRDE